MIDNRVPNRYQLGTADDGAVKTGDHSIWLVHFNSGSCNGCDIEILATLTPRYDLERLGVRLIGSPRHADVLICHRSSHTPGTRTIAAYL